ncbi:hypothetical protein PV04_01774 [Phialophora macrospora]|uniref:Uncharacterized protein n=1 Tax=Phialophora macrospora TaxID=1851006 RepID=A0A0D2D7W8_9EURO|nr:hypothetical protein PV04_01774 [Phialophora macrospora]
MAPYPEPSYCSGCGKRWGHDPPWSIGWTCSSCYDDEYFFCCTCGHRRRHPALNKPSGRSCRRCRVWIAIQSQSHSRNHSHESSQRQTQREQSGEPSEQRATELPRLDPWHEGNANYQHEEHGGYGHQKEAEHQEQEQEREREQYISVYHEQHQHLQQEHSTSETHAPAHDDLHGALNTALSDTVISQRCHKTYHCPSHNLESHHQQDDACCAECNFCIPSGRERDHANANSHSHCFSRDDSG